MRKSNYQQFANLSFILLLVIFLFYGVSMLLSDSPNITSLDPDGQSFYSGWKADLEKMKSQNLLPESWPLISKVHITNRSDSVAKWAKLITNPIPENQKGSKLLDIVILTWEENGVMAAIFQYSLLDLATNQQEWELARTIYIKGSLEKFEEFDALQK